VGHPVLAKPCFATASTGAGAANGGVDGEVRVIGHMQVLPGVQADVELSIEDAASGERLVGPYTCGGLMFTDFAPEHSCGPFDTVPARGHRCVVVQKWRYTGRGILPGGTVRSPEFSW
jgi:serine/threonine-protein kinase